MEYPINPLDLTYPRTIGNFSDGTNQTICTNSFAPGAFCDQGYNMILGDAFMRNVYALFDFGSWTAPGDQSPYIQLLSVSCSLV